jgi:phage terminase large subunit
MTSSATENKLLIRGKPNPKQQLFFDSRARFTAYGGARGGGKSWALRRKLVAMCLRYPGIRCLLVRRTLPELKSNHVLPFLREYEGLLEYSEGEKSLKFKNGSRIFLGFCATDKDSLRYQGQEYDVIAIDEATQLSEYRFSIFKACLRGTSRFPRRMYLTCNPGGIGHAWVKRLFVDRLFRGDENPDDYCFIQALVFDNRILTDADPEYVSSLRTLPERLRDAWLYGRWDVFEGQFFSEFDTSRHVCSPSDIPKRTKKFVALDYGFDMLAALLLATDEAGNLWVMRERCVPNLTLTEAAREVVSLCGGECVEFAVASPDLWNRRQDSGRSGFEIMQSVSGMPPMTSADDRRIAGWRVLREYLSHSGDLPRLTISSACSELIRCIPALLFDPNRAEDASSEPHSITHAPEALRYAVMSRQALVSEWESNDFIFPQRKKQIFFD